ncbi:SDR family NAD(P)-dependent oxidoreductase [Verminephrobacter eiseniae]|uniref:SDR family NAD(P)-dependent oxidoreductase n=1 Tax=Verminephrobacter eiseniae TaxID=364317 RepID=UPI002237899E|nr:SDR family oxidoreductase [Verminephrobacter eiseniae]MCW5238946.1 SDR family oxidoreductase [Verminephrobacter eiseniae]
MILDRFKLHGKTAVVTGAAQGIGQACAQALAEAGASVVLTDMQEEPLGAATRLLRAQGHPVDQQLLDVSDAGQVEAAHAAIIERHGTVDILVNNAGIAISNHPAETMADEVWNKVIDVNLNGTFRCCRAFGAAMLRQGRGSIVNIGSMSGFIVNRPQEQANYNASKAAVHHLTRSLAAEWGARGVRVNAVAPTYIQTQMNRYASDDPQLLRHWMGGTPMNRMGRPDEVAAVVLFLASDASSLMTGAIVLADGGYVCW